MVAIRGDKRAGIASSSGTSLSNIACFGGSGDRTTAGAAW